MNINWLIEKITESTEGYPDKVFSEKNKIYTCVNPYKYHMLRKNPQPYKNMDGIFIDGILMVWMVKLFYGKSVRRLSFDMTTIARDLFNYLNKEDNHQTIFFLGTEQSKIEKSVSIFKKYFPQMNIVGYRNGYFSDQGERTLAINEITHKQPDFVVVGLGGIIQEQFAYDLKAAGFNGIVFTCGGFLHQSSNSINYFPNWVNKYNLRMPYRLIKEKNIKRLFRVLFEFPLLFFVDSIKFKSK